VKKQDMSTETKEQKVFTISLCVVVISSLIVTYVAISLIHFAVFSDVEAPWNPWEYRPNDQRDMTKVENNLALKICWIVQTPFVLILTFFSCCIVGWRKDAGHRAVSFLAMFLSCGVFLLPYIGIAILLFANLDLNSKRTITFWLCETVWLMLTLFLVLLIASPCIAGILMAIAYGGGAISFVCVRCGKAILGAVSRYLLCGKQDKQSNDEKIVILEKDDVENKLSDTVVNIGVGDAR
jgi:hypothetical protein